MKALILSLILLITGSINSQVIIIESITLDSLIFKKINEYRISVGSPKFKAFEDSSMRAFSYRMTRKNSILENISHTDSCAYFHNVECVFNHTITSVISKYQKAVENKDWEYFANIVVDAWIKSPTHRNGISLSSYDIATVTTRITLNIKESTARLDASYHALHNSMKTKNSYSYNIKKKPAIK